jgi:type IX secretion system PorP/SprF family membrane protein
VSAPNLIESSINLSSLEEGSNKMIRHFFITSGYKFILNSDFVLQPSLLFKSTSRTPFQYDINLMTRYRDKVWIGTSYRDKDALVFMLGMDYQNYSFGLSESIDIPSN